MFPACAGMNRMIIYGTSDDLNVPRVRGDEPVMPSETGTMVICSPRARG